MGAILSKDKTPPEVVEAPRDTEAQTGQKRKNDSNKKSQKKRFKTTKERRDHFQKNNTWTAKAKSNREPKEREDGEKEERLPKKKVALLIGFNGTGYQGMQLYVIYHLLKFGWIHQII